MQVGLRLFLKKLKWENSHRYMKKGSNKENKVFFLRNFQMMSSNCDFIECMFNNNDKSQGTFISAGTCQSVHSSLLFVTETSSISS